jgi:arylsulfatase A-like enzyme
MSGLRNTHQGRHPVPVQFIKTLLGIVIAGLFLQSCGPAGTESETKSPVKSPVESQQPAPPAERPNILWLSVEDISTHIGAYGYTQAVTPTIDALAANGVRFDNAYAPAPVCAVARSSLITGIYSVAQGSQFMRTDIVLPAGIKPFPWYLRQAGYFTTNRKKTDYQFQPPEGTWDHNSAEHRDYEERSDPSQPFFSVINFSGTHESRNRGEYDAALFDPETLELPAFYPDTPKIRRFWASYYQNIHKADAWIAEELARLEAAGLADDTIVVVWADHGVGFPRGKRWITTSV